MNREEMLAILSKCLDVPEHSIRVFLHAYFDTAKHLIRGGEAVDLGGLGIFTYMQDGETGFIQYYPPLPGPTAAIVPASKEELIVPLEAVKSKNEHTGDLINVEELLSTFLPQSGIITSPKADKRDTEHDGQTGPSVQEKPRSDSVQPAISETEAERTEELPETVYYDVAADTDTTFEEAGNETTAEFETDSDTLSNYAEDDITEASEVVTAPIHSLTDTYPYSDSTADEDASLQSEVTTTHIQQADDGMAKAGSATATQPVAKFADEQSHQGFTDKDSFYKNRDQLFNPPEKKTSRGLFIAALVLTIGVFIIILYMLYSNTPAHELPGIDAATGHLYKPSAVYTK